MKKIYSLLLLTVVILCSCSKDDDNSAVLDFKGLLTQSESQYAGNKNAGKATTDYYYKNTFTDKGGLCTFDNYVDESLSFGGGFTYTNKTDVTTAGYTNISAITGKGVNGDTYLTSNTSSYTPAKFVFSSSASYIIKGIYVTNCVYTYLSMKNGDSYAKKFVSGDWLKLTATGLDKSGNATGTTDIYLADYRDGKTIMLNQWTWFDLSSLGTVAGIKFDMSSSDSGSWGMNTPSYFCLDGITIEL